MKICENQKIVVGTAVVEVTENTNCGEAEQKVDAEHKERRKVAELSAVTVKDGNAKQI